MIQTSCSTSWRVCVCCVYTGNVSMTPSVTILTSSNTVCVDSSFQSEACFLLWLGCVSSEVDFMCIKCWSSNIPRIAVTVTSYFVSFSFENIMEWLEGLVISCSVYSILRFHMLGQMLKGGRVVSQWWSMSLQDDKKCWLQSARAGTCRTHRQCPPFCSFSLWKLLQAEHAHITTECVPLLLHCITLPSGADIFWKLIDNDFGSEDWKERFAAGEGWSQDIDGWF